MEGEKPQEHPAVTTALYSYGVHPKDEEDQEEEMASDSRQQVVMAVAHDGYDNIENRYLEIN